MSQLQNMLMKPLVAVAPDDTLALAVELMEREKVGAVVVVQQARPVGIITDRDIALALGARGATTDDWVQKYMTCPVTTMRQDEGIYSATQYMMENALRRVPVIDGAGNAIGLVSLDDLLILLSRELNNLAKSVRFELSPAI
jgi:CBS domain-containing protein